VFDFDQVITQGEEDIMEIKIEFPENSVNGHKVNALAGDHVIHTDQPKSYGAEDSAPAPFVLFLGSIATCSGWFLLRFLEARNISLEGVSLKMTTRMDKETRLVPEVKFELTLPESFPAKYHKAVIAAIHQCAVTRHLMNPPRFATDIVVNDDVVVSQIHQG